MRVRKREMKLKEHQQKTEKLTIAVRKTKKLITAKTPGFSH